MINYQPLDESLQNNSSIPFTAPSPGLDGVHEQPGTLAHPRMFMTIFGGSDWFGRSNGLSANQDFINPRQF
jgi:hypothetical protein